MKCPYCLQPAEITEGTGYCPACGRTLLWVLTERTIHQVRNTRKPEAVSDWENLALAQKAAQVLNEVDLE